jgi:hypothetical protein
MSMGRAGWNVATLALLLASVAPLAAADIVDFLRDVKPILAQRCFRCHSSLEQESNLRLDGVPAILKGGDSGEVVVPGKSGESRLIAAVERRGELKMPPEGESLTEQQIATLRAWIDAGAIASPAEAEAKSNHWSFQKPTRPPVPLVADPAWSANPIDAFIAAKHAELKLTPVGEAPPNLLLRRVYLDLIGLPPSAAELQEFLAVSPSLPPSVSLSSQEGEKERRSEREREAYNGVVDKLLASPHYGERWGRHWMDVWRYSDWDGYGNEIRESKPHIWRWRDWIIESLNTDKPYDQMVQEMLAADELAPDDPDALRATGFLVRNWYKFNRNKWLDDTVEHTGKAFLGMTFNCCRCHDHMYDPLAQREYYALRAFFEPYDIRTDRLPGEANTNKVGLVRAFDAKLDEPTFVFARGNEKNPLKDEPIAPAVPRVLAGAACSVEPVRLSRLSSYPGLATFVRDETLAAARDELEMAKAARNAAEKKLADVQKTPPAFQPTPDPRPPSLDPALVDADAQFAVAAAALAAGESNLAFVAARLVADDAVEANAPSDRAKELTIAAATIERRLKLQQTERRLIQAQINLTTAQRAKKDNDAKSAAAVTTAEAALTAAAKARVDALDAQDKPAESYTHFTSTYPSASTGRRTALARWITSADNPLAARVAINHIWLRHFGSPLVPTVFDFGINGKPPTNQPLLDWLAVELMESGWRMKHIHKLIVTSRTYRLASSAERGTRNAEQVVTASIPHSELPARSLVDPENTFYWRFNPRRMEAEIVRDATLSVAGSLDPARGGPDLDPTSGLTVGRRSIYFRSTKEKKMQFLSLFDSANPVECYRRSESIAPQQALALANSTLTLAQARILAKKLTGELTGTSPDKPSWRFVRDAFVRILCREPTDDELTTCLAFLREQSTALADQKAFTAFSTGPAASVAPSVNPQQRARENLVHVLLNHNDFVTIR